MLKGFVLPHSLRDIESFICSIAALIWTSCEALEQNLEEDEMTLGCEKTLGEILSEFWVATRGIKAPSSLATIDQIHTHLTGKKKPLLMMHNELGVQSNSRPLK